MNKKLLVGDQDGTFSGDQSGTINIGDQDET